MKIERILVRGTNWLGDAVMTTPALERLRSSFPQAEISLLANPQTAELFQSSNFINEVVEYHRREQGVEAFIEAIGKLRSRRFDLALLFQNAFEAALLAWIGKIGLRIGFADQYRGLMLTHKLHRRADNHNRHQTHDYLDIVAECERICLGEDFVPANKNPLPSLTVTSEQKDVADELLGCYGIVPHERTLVALNVGATNSRAKCWPSDQFAELADRMVNEMNAQIVLIGGASELDYAEQVIWRMKSSGAVNLAGKTDMAELIGLLSVCDLLVSNDTGPAHLSAAIGTPTLTLFGPTNEFETAPTGPRAELIRAENIECARCMHRSCPIDHRCMTRLTVDEVFARSRQLLSPERGVSFRATNTEL